MKKKDFVTLIMIVIGDILFALDMCMVLLPEWGAMSQGVVIGIVSAAVLLAMVPVRRKMDGKPAIVLNGKVIGTIFLGIFGAVVLGVGMCCTTLPGWEQYFIPGIVIGIIGITGVIAAYPIYARMVKRRRSKLAPEILRLADELMK